MIGHISSTLASWPSRLAKAPSKIRWPTASHLQCKRCGATEVLLCSIMDRIGVRELRQHASRYLARVATGETIEVTDRGRAVALLVPTRQDRWQYLIASGQVVPAAIEGDLVDEPPGDYRIDASARLAAMRDDER